MDASILTAAWAPGELGIDCRGDIVLTDASVGGCAMGRRTSDMQVGDLSSGRRTSAITATDAVAGVWAVCRCTADTMVAHMPWGRGWRHHNDRPGGSFPCTPLPPKWRCAHGVGPQTARGRPRAAVGCAAGPQPLADARVWAVLVCCLCGGSAVRHPSGG